MEPNKKFEPTIIDKTEEGGGVIFISPELVRRLKEAGRKDDQRTPNDDPAA